MVHIKKIYSFFYKKCEKYYKTRHEKNVKKNWVIISNNVVIHTNDNVMLVML